MTLGLPAFFEARLVRVPPALSANELSCPLKASQSRAATVLDESVEQSPERMSMTEAIPDTSYIRPQYEGGSRPAAALVLCGLSAVFLVSLFYSPPDTDYIPLCMFKALTSLPCPGCGLTHSFCALAKGNITAAFEYNALGPPLFLLAIGFWIRSAAVLAGKTGFVIAFDRVARGPRLARLLIIALLCYGVLRIVYIAAWAPELIHKGALLKLLLG